VKPSAPCLSSFVVMLAVLAMPADSLASRAAPPCTGYIDAVPAVVSSRGRWCLRKNLGTAMSSGAAVTIAANDVTIDCDRYGINGLSGGDASTATGIQAIGRAGVRVERCLTRGFRTGVGLSGSRLIVVDNFVDQAKRIGIDITGDSSELRDNTINDIGGNNVPTSAVYGMRVAGTVDVVDNRVINLRHRLNDPYAAGIGVQVNGNPGGLIRGNVLLGQPAEYGASSYGIRLATSAGAIVHGNYVDKFDRGVACDSTSIVVADNALHDVAEPAPGCTVDGSTQIAARAPASRPMPTELRHCDGWIDDIPATISTAGNYCLRKNVSTAIASGSAIYVSASRVSIDCRGFMISGTSAGPASTARGIALENSFGAIRNCIVRGFRYGIDGNGLDSIEDNRVEGSFIGGIQGGTVIRRNRVLDIGGYDGGTHSLTGVTGFVVTDNIIHGVAPPNGTVANVHAYGIFGGSNIVFGNRIRGVAGAGSGIVAGIYGSRVRFLQHNTVAAAPVGATCYEPGTGVPVLVGANVFASVPTPLLACTDGGNQILP
jgi:hypothetical protein